MKKETKIIAELIAWIPLPSVNFMKLEASRSGALKLIFSKDTKFRLENGLIIFSHKGSSYDIVLSEDSVKKITTEDGRRLLTKDKEEGY